MRRPIPVKSFFCSPMISSFFFRSAKPPLSPPFHPHSYVSDSRSVPVGCSRFSRRCHLVIVLFLTFWVGIGRRHLSQSPKPSMVGSKAANGGQVKTGQRMWPGTQMFYPVVCILGKPNRSTELMTVGFVL